MLTLVQIAYWYHRLCKSKAGWVASNRNLISALKRGIGVHHAGMPVSVSSSRIFWPPQTPSCASLQTQYRQLVEVLYRGGFLGVVFATATLALGINMPCRTVVFGGNSIFLNPLYYRQMSGRAGRRGYDHDGNVVFHCVPLVKRLQLQRAEVTPLRGQPPFTVSMVLRLITLAQQVWASSPALACYSCALPLVRTDLHSSRTSWIASCRVLCTFIPMNTKPWTRGSQHNWLTADKSWKNWLHTVAPWLRLCCGPVPWLMIAASPSVRLAGE